MGRIRKPTTFTMSSETDAKLDHLASCLGTSRSDVLDRLISAEFIRSSANPRALWEQSQTGQAMRQKRLYARIAAAESMDTVDEPTYRLAYHAVEKLWASGPSESSLSMDERGALRRLDQYIAGRPPIPGTHVATAIELAKVCESVWNLHDSLLEPSAESLS